MSLIDRVRTALAPQPPAPVDRPTLTARFDSLFNSLTGLGGAGDKGAASRPNVYTPDLSHVELLALWRHNGIARRIVNLLPAEATRKGWQVPDIGTADETLQIHERVKEAMQWARLWGGSLLVPITEDDVPGPFRAGGWLMQPLQPKRIGKVTALQVFDASDARPGPYSRDVRSPLYRQPEWWEVYTDGGLLRIHASRVLHFRGAPRPPSERESGIMPDDSVIQAVWDEVRRLCDTAAGGAVLAAEIRESVLRIGGLEQMAVGDQAAAVEERAKLFAKSKSLLNMILLGPGDAYENRSNPPNGFRELSDAAKSMLAAVVGWPMIVLFGDTPAGFSTDGSSGWQTFNRVVSAEQERHRYLLEQLYTTVYSAQDGPTRGEVPSGRYLKFLPLDEPTEKGKADAYGIVAQADALYIDRGVLDPEDVRRERFGADEWQVNIGGLEPLPEGASFEDLADRVDAAEPPPSVCILIPAAAPSLPLPVAVDAPDDAPHVTLLYLGATPHVDEVVQAVTTVGTAMNTVLLENGRVAAFPHGPDGTPIVVEYDPWPLDQVHAALLRRLAHLITARQHPTFRPHLTLGYASEPSPEERAALLEVDASAVRVPVAELHVCVGREVVARVAVGG